MLKDNDHAPFVSFGADMKKARLALGYTQKAFAEEIGIDPRYLANIENSGALPSLSVFYEIVSRCKLPIERYFYPAAAEVRESQDMERAVLKLRTCPKKFLPIIEGALDAAMKLEDT